MGEVYDKMLRDLKLKNLAGRTQEEYLRCCAGFVRYHMKSPREMGETAIKEYLAHLLLRGAGPETLKMNVAAVTFLYRVTLDRPKVGRASSLAEGGAQETGHSQWHRVGDGVVEDGLAGAGDGRDDGVRGAGLRVSEVCRLRVEDIDSKRGLIHVRLGKGNKDRYAMLPERLLGALRGYWGPSAA